MRYLSFVFMLLFAVQVQSKDSLSLYLFLLDDCPITLDNTLTINELHQEYGSDISFVGYFPNLSSKPKKIKSFKETFKIKFELYSDYDKVQSKKWKATVTPEVILYNHTQEKILYRGRIDNKFVRLGKRRNVVTKHDLKEAIIATLENKVIAVQTTKPIGCFINYSDRSN